MLISQESFDKYKNQIGSKTLNLKKLCELGLNVPEFYAIASTSCNEIYYDNSSLDDLVKEISQVLNVKKYSVRSSSLIEDTNTESYAGQFKTLVNVESCNLKSAILEVLNHAYEFLEGNLNKFSLIIQKYIEVDYSGVVFTRNPEGSRELIIEYHKGIGEKLVSGLISPTSKSFYHKQNTKNSKPKFLSNVFELGKKIENFYGYPQDIEFGVVKNTVYLFQTRPITTLNLENFEKFKFGDSHFNQAEILKLEKSEISEICPRPNYFMESLLRLIYAENGPVSNVYSKYEIAFRYKNFIKIIGNELYIDKEREIKSLFPSYSLNHKTLKPKFNLGKHSFDTIRNIVRVSSITINKIKIDEIRDQLYKKLKSKIEKIENIASNQNVLGNISEFMIDYELIFEINLLAEKAVKNLEQSITKDKMEILELLELSFFDDNINSRFNLNELEKLINELKLTGNSLDIADTSDFKMYQKDKINNEMIDAWFDNIPKWRKIYLQPQIYNLQRLIKFREAGRWLTVLNINIIRDRLQEFSKLLELKDDELIYFASIDELNDNSLSVKELERRRKNYHKFDKFELPSVLSSVYLENTKKDRLKCLSKGSTTGKLTSVDILITNSDWKETQTILYTKTLSPELTKYFPVISGIVTEKGGLLSHLAIIAREKGIPVLSGFKLGEINLGDYIKLDASECKIEIQKTS